MTATIIAKNHALISSLQMLCGCGSGGFRLGPGGHRHPNLAQAPQILIGSVVHCFYQKDSAALKYAQNALAAGAWPRTPLGGAHDAPPDPLVGWGGGHPLPRPHASRRLDPRTFSVQHSLLGATFLAYTHLNFWQYTTIGSIVISLSRGCLPNDEGPGPPNIFSQNRHCQETKKVKLK